MRLLVPLLALLPSALVLAAPAGKSPLPRATEVTTVKGRTITIRSDAKEPTKFDTVSCDVSIHKWLLLFQSPSQV